MPARRGRKAAAVVDEHGQTLLPGLHRRARPCDGARLRRASARSRRHPLACRVAAAAARLCGGASRREWILGAGWNQELWPDKRFPTAADLDAVVGDRPVVLERVDGHALVANSAAMKAAGVTAQTPAPAGGEIDNGLFVDTARELIDTAIPQPTPAELDEAFAKAQDILLGFGVTGVGSMSTSLDDWNAFRRAGDAGRLQVRLMVYARRLDPLNDSPASDGWLYGDRLRAVGHQILRRRRARLARRVAQAALCRHAGHARAAVPFGRRAARAGRHGGGARLPDRDPCDRRRRQCAGDQHLRMAERQISAPTAAGGSSMRRSSICADLPRIGRPALIASMQPTHQTSDRLMAEKRLDPARLECAYAWQSMLKTGAKLAFGTDFPVESPNPFPGLSAAVSRQDINGQPPGGWYPAQRLTLGAGAPCLHARRGLCRFCRGQDRRARARQMGRLHHRRPRPDQSQRAELARTEVLETWVGRKKVWERAPSAVTAERGK